MTAVIVIGGGFTGTAVAIALSRRAQTPLDIAVIEPRVEVGRGVAYSATDRDHRINAPAASHFVTADDAEGLNFLDNISCHRLNMALRTICVDDMGKEAIRDSLNLVKLKNVKDKSEMKINFDAGVLEMHCAYALRTDGMYSDNEIREVLMAKL